MRLPHQSLVPCTARTVLYTTEDGLRPTFSYITRTLVASFRKKNHIVYFVYSFTVFVRLAVQPFLPLMHSEHTCYRAAYPIKLKRQCTACVHTHTHTDTRRHRSMFSQIKRQSNVCGVLCLLSCWSARAPSQTVAATASTNTEVKKYFVKYLLFQNTQCKGKAQRIVFLNFY